MIKANELRIGSLVYVLYQVSTITSINESDVDSHDCKDIPIKELRPIPITEEWLVKLGLKIKYGTPANSRAIYTHFGKYRIYLSQENKPCSIHIDAGDWFPELCEFEYIHQLQNLYFALTGEELTITKTNE